MPARLPSSSNLPGRRKPSTRLRPLGTSDGGPGQPNARRGSISGLASAPKAQRTSKTSHKLVVLPSAPQTRALPTDVEEDLTLAAETDGGVREYKSEAERMSKEQRKQAGYKRITAYCVAESFKMKLLASFLKREHNVSPRVFDEALYVVSMNDMFFEAGKGKLTSFCRCTICRYCQAMDLARTFAPLPQQH